MEEKVKRWIEIEYEYTIKHKGNIPRAIDKCYGVLLFAVNELFDGYNANLANWWGNEMFPKFRQAEREE